MGSSTWAGVDVDVVDDLALFFPVFCCRFCCFPREDPFFPRGYISQLNKS